MNVSTAMYHNASTALLSDSAGNVIRLYSTSSTSIINGAIIVLLSSLAACGVLVMILVLCVMRIMIGG